MSTTVPASMSDTDRIRSAGHTGAPERGRAGIALSVFWLLVTVMWWALAFVPVAEPPTWLVDARSVCFGSTENGLPDTYGWIVLVLGPASMLAGILGAWGRDIREDLVALWGLPVARMCWS